MAEYLIQSTTLSAIGDAIRAKDGTANQIPVPDIAARILAIQTAGATLTITAPAGATVTAAMGGESYTKVADSSGVAVFSGLATGTWTITISDGVHTSSKKIFVTYEYAESIGFSTIPEFTYSGDYEIVDDSDTPITTTTGNWKIRFLTSGILRFSSLSGASDGIDIFCVGGGGGSYSGSGGCGGYTNTATGVHIAADTDYAISVGAGGAVASSGGNSSFGSLASASGGGTGCTAGGSGGGGGGYRAIDGGGKTGGAGGSDGSDGVNGYGTASTKNGTGQGTTTREFGESTGTLYAGGGGGAAPLSTDTPGAGGAGGGGNGGYFNGASGGNGGTNTGGGGGGYNGVGGSGIVIIRNARGAA